MPHQQPHTRTSKYGKKFRAGHGLTPEQERYLRQVQQYYEGMAGGRILRRKKARVVSI